MAGRKSDFTLTKLDDLFTTQAQREEEKLSKIRDIPLGLIDDFPDHPFKVRDDEDMLQLIESIRDRGVITPASYHPEYKDMYYPINYGYIEGVMAPDGEEQDAYILGVNEPVKKFTGKIIAIVRRKDGIEEKWVVVPDGVTFSKEEIRRQIHFQEQYFDSEIVM